MIFSVNSGRDVDPYEIQAVRQSVGWIPDEVKTWEETLNLAHAVRSVYQNDELAGIGFAVGVPRHLQIVDLCVRSRYQGKGIGSAIMRSLIESTDGSPYVTLTTDEKTPGLQEYYENFGFEVVSNAMRLLPPGSDEDCVGV